MLDEKPKVFVYGTLKTGHYNNRILQRSNGIFLGEFKTEPEFTMKHLGAFPGVLTEGNTSIQGEVFEVDDLSCLDQLEGYPHFYDRVLIDTSYGQAWVYYLPPEPYQDRPDIPSGVWE